MAKCYVCGEDVQIKQTKKGKPYYCCTECGTQVFARGAESVKRLTLRASGDIETVPEPEAREASSNGQKCTIWGVCE